MNNDFINNPMTSVYGEPEIIEDVNARIFRFTDMRGRFQLKAYAGKRTKPDLLFYFTTEEAREKCVANWLEGLRARAAAKKQRATERKEHFPTDLAVGDVLHYSWGYDQTNAEFYVVLAISGKSVTIAQCGSMQDKATGWASNTLVANPAVVTGEPMRKIAQRGYQGETYLNMKHGVASKWSGRPMHNSWYA